jgi:hypothetical protein
VPLATCTGTDKYALSAAGQAHAKHTRALFTIPVLCYPFPLLACRQPTFDYLQANFLKHSDFLIGINVLHGETKKGRALVKAENLLIHILFEFG